MNELSAIFHGLDIDTSDGRLAAAEMNFLNFQLVVGGHCIVSIPTI